MIVKSLCIADSLSTLSSSLSSNASIDSVCAPMLHAHVFVVVGCGCKIVVVYGCNMPVDGLVVTVRGFFFPLDNELFIGAVLFLFLYIGNSLCVPTSICMRDAGLVHVVVCTIGDTTIGEAASQSSLVCSQTETD